MMHLRPRHLFRLMQTSKVVYEEINTNEYYFHRLALQLLYSYYHSEYGDGDIADKRDYFMLNPRNGYHAEMENYMACAIQRINTKFPEMQVKDVYGALIKFSDAMWDYIDDIGDLPSLDRLRGVKQAIDSIVEHELQTFCACDLWKISKEHNLAGRSLGQFVDDDITMTTQQKSGLVKSLVNHLGKYHDEPAWMIPIRLYGIPSKLAAWVIFMNTNQLMFSIPDETRQEIITRVLMLVTEAYGRRQTQEDIVRSFRALYPVIQNEDRDNFFGHRAMAELNSYVNVVTLFHSLEGSRYNE